MDINATTFIFMLSLPQLLKDFCYLWAIQLTSSDMTRWIAYLSKEKYFKYFCTYILYSFLFFSMCILEDIFKICILQLVCFNNQVLDSESESGDRFCSLQDSLLHKTLHCHFLPSFWNSQTTSQMLNDSSIIIY